MTPDYTVEIRTNRDALLEEFQSKFPKEQVGIRKLFDFMAETDAMTLYVKLKRGTFGQLMDQYLKDWKLKAILGILLGNIGLPSSRASALSGVFLFREFVFDGGYYPKGGMQAFCDALVERFREYGGTVSFLTPVTGIDVERGSVKGVFVKGDRFVRCRYVISTADPFQTFGRLVRGYQLNGRLSQQLQRSEASISAFMLYVGTRKSIHEAVKYHCCTWYYPGYDIDQCYLNWLEGRPEFDKGFIFASYPSFHDKELAPPGKDAIQFIVGAPYVDRGYWESRKEGIADQIVERAEAFIPGLSKNIELRMIATPMTLVKYTGNHRGAMYGWASTPEQVAENRFPEQTPVRGLFLSGHWAGPPAGQGGIPMAVYSGRNVARLIVRDRKTGVISFARSTKEHRRL